MGSNGVLEKVVVRERGFREPSTHRAEPPRKSTGVAALFPALRPKQWAKNAVLFVGILFTLDQGHSLGAWLRVAGAFAVFCALASAIYLINDICDVEQDRTHPRKRHRPIAAGRVTPRLAGFTAALLATLGLLAAAALGTSFALVSVTYVALTVAYSVKLKHVVLIDVMALAACYVIRAIAGAVVIDVKISAWLLMCTTFVALLIGLAKRRNELLTLSNAGSHRAILDEYTGPMLDQFIGVITACTLVAYLLYTFFSPTAQKHPLLMLTIPFMLYGVFRFLYMMHRHGKGGDPSSELLEDRNMLACAILWFITSAAVILLA